MFQLREMQLQCVNGIVSEIIGNEDDNLFIFIGAGAGGFVLISASALFIVKKRKYNETAMMNNIEINYEPDISESGNEEGSITKRKMIGNLLLLTGFIKHDCFIVFVF